MARWSRILLGPKFGADQPRRLGRDTKGVYPILRIGIGLPADVAMKTAGPVSIGEIDAPDLGNPVLHLA